MANAELSALRKSEIEAGFSTVRQKMAQAGAGGSVCLLAATKHVPAAEINYAIETLGLTLIGENRVQELLEKYDAIRKDKAEIHFIGSLQSNKVKYIVGKVALIHSLDSLSLAAEIQKQAAKHNLIQDVLVEVNVCGEESKSGVLPSEVPLFLNALARFPNVRVRGLMTMGKKGMTEAEYRMHFGAVHDIWRALHEKDENIDILSMGMSDSYEVAIGCGSTLVRVGTALFGSRTY